MKKRGILTLELLVKLVPVLLLLLVFFAAIYIIIPALFSTSDKETVDTINSLAYNVESMLSTNDGFKYNTMTSTFKQNILIKGFSSDQRKPPACGSDPCICVWSDDTTDVSTAKPSTCKSFSDLIYYDKVVFLTTPDPNQLIVDDYTRKHYGVESFSFDVPYPAPLDNENVPYGNLLIINSLTGDIKNYNEVYIEKYANSRTVYILIANIVEESGWFNSGINYEEKNPEKIKGPQIGITQKQIDERKEKLVPCPRDSDTKCVGQVPYAKVLGGICRKVTERCEFMEIEDCELDVKLQKRCLCASEIAQPGEYCTRDVNGNFIPLAFSCKQIGKCEDYCKITGPVDDFRCESTDEKEHCIANPCKLENGCKNSGNSCVTDVSS